MIAPGVYDGIPDTDYHASPGISNSGLVLIANRTPAHYRAQLDEPRKETPALTDGRMIHRVVLEPELFATEYAVVPKWDMRRNADKDAAILWAAENVGRTAITLEKLDWLHRIRDSVHAHPTARILLSGGRSERSVYANDPVTGVRVRCRPDYDNGYSLVDVKSTENASPDAFTGSGFKYGYHQQAAFYLDVYEWATGRRSPAFFFVAVEKEPPYAVKVFEASPSFISRGREAYRGALDLYAECLANDRWPAYDNDVSTLDLPVWAENMLQAKDNDEIEGISYVQ